MFDYSGEVVSESEYNGSSAYAIGVEDAAGCSFVVDAADATVSSVARYVNHAASGAAECNCVLTEHSRGPWQYNNKVTFVKVGRRVFKSVKEIRLYTRSYDLKEPYSFRL